MFLECATSSGWFSRFYEFIRHGNLEIVATWLVSSFFGGKKKEKTSLYIYIYIKEVCKECLNSRISLRESSLSILPTCEKINLILFVRIRHPCKKKKKNLEISFLCARI